MLRPSFYNLSGHNLPNFNQGVLQNHHAGIMNVNALPGSMGHCTLCGRQSLSVCQRCRDFYCSPDCQKRDWQRHRYICFPMPTLIPYNLYENNASKVEAMPLITTLNMENKPNENKMSQPNQRLQQHSQQKQQTQQKQEPQQKKHQPQENNNDDNISVSSSVKGMSMPRVNVVPPVAKMPKANSMVMLTAFHSTNRCYVRSLNPQDDQEYRSILTKVDNFGKNAPPMRVKPTLNSYAITQKDKLWYRVQIVGNQGAYKVLFLDLGQTSRRNIKELRQVSNEIVGLQLYPYIIQLHGVPNCQKTESVYTQFREFECKEFRIEYSENDKTGVTAKLIEWKTEKLLNDVISEKCQSMAIYNKNSKQNPAPASVTNNVATNETDSTKTSTGPNIPKTSNASQQNNKSVTSDDDEGEPQSKQEVTVASVHSMPTTNGRGPPKQIQGPVMNPPFKMHSLQVDSRNVPVIVMDDSCLEYGYIGVLPKHAFENFNAIHKYLANYNDNMQPYTPKVEEFCLAKYNNEWFRAKVIETTDDNKFTVVYIDFTNEATITIDEIRRYPRGLTNDCYSNLCLVHGLPDEPSENELLALKKMFSARKEIVIDHVKAIIDNIVQIEYRKVFDLNQK